jgi:hypothetical protein
MAVDEDILSLMRMRGPLLPADVAKHVKTNILIGSAYLSELASRKKIKISSLKVGGSPLYFLQGQEDKLEEFASNLNEKELRAFEILKEQKVLRDTHLTPLMRVALQNIKDFAVPLTVTFDNKKENFWKWHLTSESEFETVVRKELGMEEKPVEPVLPKEAPQEVVPKKERKKKVAVKVLEGQETIQEKIVPKVVQKIEVPVEKIVKPAVKDVKKQKIEVKKVEPELKKIADEKLTEKAVEMQKPEPKKLPEEKLQSMVEKPELLTRARDFFKSREIKIVQEQLVRKNAEASYIVQIPSAMGHLSYLCKVHVKGSCNDKDLSSALVEGQLKKLPVVLVHEGKLTKKAQELVKTEPFRTMVFYQLNDGH